MVKITHSWIKVKEEAVLIKNDCLEDCLDEKIVDMFADNGFEIVKRKRVNISLDRALSLYLDEVIEAENDWTYRYRIAGALNIVGKGDILIIRDSDDTSEKCLQEKVVELKGSSNDANTKTIRGRFRETIPEGIDEEELLMVTVRNRIHFYRDKKEKLAFECFLADDYFYEESSYRIDQRPTWYQWLDDENEYLGKSIIEFQKSSLYPSLRIGRKLHDATNLEEAKKLILRYWMLSDYIEIKPSKYV